MNPKKIFRILICAILSMPMALFAQFVPTANLTIFSEDGLPFYLILNGERQNDEPQTNIRIEELPQPYYTCKILFEDKTLKAISKNNLMLTDANGVPQDVTYKIKMDKKGTPVLRFFSFIPAEQNMIRPSNVAVYRFGNHSPLMVPGGQVGVQQTTTVQTTRGRAPGVGLNVNAAGVNLNVNVTDPLGQEITTTTTTTTTTNHRQSGFDDHFDQGHANLPDCSYPMSNRNFEEALQLIKNDGFDETRLSNAKQIASSNCLSANQVISICKLFSFEESKLDFAKFAYDYCTERRNYFKVNSVFSFEGSRTELNSYIQGR